MSALEEIQQAVSQIAGQVGPAVVGVGNGWRGGSGVVVAEGQVLTNAHNLRGERVTVSFADGRETEASLAGVDLDGDLAVVRVDTARAAAVQWADHEAPSIGQPVFALSNPRGQGLRVTFGIVSGVERAFRGPRGRRITGSLEHTAPLSPGSSGGPVVDSQGRFLGLNTNRLGEGFYLAIPADESLRERVAALGRGEAPGRPRLGIAVAPGHVARRMRRAVGLPERDGVLVRGVEEGSPAAGAGLQEGDLIVEAAGRPTSTVDDLQEALARAGTGASIELRVLRGAEERTVSVQPTEERAA
jgi:S1-C subfamily serine protease